MCGIAGIYNLNGSNSSVSPNRIESMLKAIRHRGPDESGIYSSEKIGMGSVRLSIIDLSSGQQPMSVRNNRYWIVYNGELFNYIELKEELVKRGCTFTNNSDTEVVVQAYAEFGPDCLQKFNGQYAIAIWDKEKEELFLARDRVGIRPLFYTLLDGSLYFCSEIKGIFRNQEIPREIQPTALSQVFNFWTTISPQTPYKGILELPPGHYMQVSSKGRIIRRYWGYNFPEKAHPPKIDLNQASERFHDLFEDAVKIRLRADVEVAAYLSGGIDSSVTTAFIKKIEPKVLNTYSIGFSDAVFDESKFQNEAADYFETKHLAFSCTNEEIGENFYNSTYYSEFPILRTAPTPMYLLSKKVRQQNIKVVITGEGADEMLAGYNIFKETKIRRFWASQPSSAIRPLLLKKLYPYLPMMKDARSNALKMFFGYKLEETDNPYYSHILRWHNTSRIQNYFSEHMKSALKGYSPLEKLPGFIDPAFEQWDDLARAQYLEASIFMSGYLLSSQGDRMAMGNSVEGRYPFLDHRVIEFATNLPDRLKLNSLNEKFLLKKMMKGKIPESVLNRSKQAYRAPISMSFFGEKQPEYVKELLSDNKLKEYGYFNTEPVSRLLSKAISGGNMSEIENMSLAAILSTQLVHYFFIQGNMDLFDDSELQALRVIEDHN